MIFIDESWEVLDDCAEFLNALARMLRLCGGSLVIGGHSYDEMFSTENKRKLLESMTWKIMFHHSEDFLSLLTESGSDEELLPLMNSLASVPGLYSECLITSPHLKVVGRLMLDQYSDTLFSTDLDDYKYIEDKKKQGKSTDEAIEMLINNQV